MVLSNSVLYFNETTYSAAYTGFKPSVAFTLASTRDRTPTVTAGRLGLLATKKDKLIKLTLTSTKNVSKGSGKTYEVYFRLNRFSSPTNATFVAASWPKNLRQPKVGEPANFAVLSVDFK
jgi:hypothetical protein